MLDHLFFIIIKYLIKIIIIKDFEFLNLIIILFIFIINFIYLSYL